MAVLDAFVRAVGTCLHPQLMLRSLAPWGLGAAALALLGWLGWERAVDGTRALLDGWALLPALLDWLDGLGLQALRPVLAPLVVVALMTPLLMLGSLLLVAMLLTPAVVRDVATRRFPGLQRQPAAGGWRRVVRRLAAFGLALLALALSVPLWLVPPLVLLLPALVAGWLTRQVLAFDVLAAHASAAETSQLLRGHRRPLQAMGLASGLLATAPALIWAQGVIALVLAPVLALVALWLYLLVFTAAAAWHAHYLLAALQALRASVPMAADAPLTSAHA